MKNTVTLIILDGWGHNPDQEANAIALAKTPNFDRICAQYPNGFLKAHGNAVGLPKGQMGNSEVGHTTIGAGRVVWMDLPKIDRAVEDGSLAKNTVLMEGLSKVNRAGGRVHIMGCASNGGVHAHEDHLVALTSVAVKNNVTPVLHLFADGRDVAPRSAEESLPKLIEKMPKEAVIGTLMGRFYAMDRDNRWERIKKAYDAIVNGAGARAETVSKGIQQAYDSDEGDEFISPTIIKDYQGVKSGDGLLFANFRADRAREILSALADDNFEGFQREKREWSSLMGMVSYSNEHDEYIEPLFQKENLKNTLGELVSRAGKSQLRLAETEKYPHVTFFMNGGAEKLNKNEDRYMAESPKVRTYDLKPEMSAVEVGEKLQDSISSGKYDLIICNFANPDMVGHTGDLPAAIRAVEAVDKQLGIAVNACEKMGQKMIVTADHGNCEVMIDPQTKEAHTAHTLNPVPYIIVGETKNVREYGGLCDLAPTLLHLMNIEKPSEMSGKCLIE